ncbi:MAG: hypothetical protein AB7F76_12955 [Parvibaculaceae bacterium]
MNIRFSDALLRDVRQVLDQTERRGETLQAYEEAARIQARNPRDNVALEDIVDALIRGAGRIQAVELQPPRTLEVLVELNAAEGSALAHRGDMLRKTG